MFALSVDAGFALAQTKSGEPEPQAVEPQAGEAAPATPGATTAPVEPLPEPLVTEAVPTGPATAGGAPATAGGAPAAASQDDDSGLSWADAGALVLAALLIAAAIVLVLWQLRGWDPRWLRRWRHATAEAGWRLSLGWAEFRDFVRIGR